MDKLQKEMFENSMSIGELIAELQKWAPEDRVLIKDDHDCNYGEIHKPKEVGYSENGDIYFSIGSCPKSC